MAGGLGLLLNSAIILLEQILCLGELLFIEFLSTLCVRVDLFVRDELLDFGCHMVLVSLWHCSLLYRQVMVFITCEALLRHFVKRTTICLRGRLVFDALSMHKIRLMMVDREALASCTVLQTLLSRILGVLTEIDNILLCHDVLFWLRCSILLVSSLVLLVSAARGTFRSWPRWLLLLIK